MTRFIEAGSRKYSRLAVAVALLAVWGAGVTLGSQRSTSSRAAAAMTTAASKWLEALTPEQRQQATLRHRRRRKGALELHPHEHVAAQGRAVEGDERAAAQARARAAQGGSQPEGLPDRHVNHGARDHPPRDRELGRQEGRERARSRALLLHRVRGAIGQEHLGLARRRPPPLPALHDRQQHRGGQYAGVLRHEPGGSARRRTEEGCAAARLDGRRRAGVDGIV